MHVCRDLGRRTLLCLHLTSLSQNPKLAKNAFKYTLLLNGIIQPLSLVKITAFQQQNRCFYRPYFFGKPLSVSSHVPKSFNSGFIFLNLGICCVTAYPSSSNHLNIVFNSLTIHLMNLAKNS